MMIQVRCRCAQRTIDTANIGSWKLRCKTCHEIIYDPEARAAPAIPTETSDEEQTQFNQWLQGSAELKVLMSSESEDGAKRCPRHPEYKLVAACSRCEKLLCKRCLDRVGEAFTCGDCTEKQLAESREAEKRGGIVGLLKRLLGR